MESQAKLDFLFVDKTTMHLKDIANGTDMKINVDFPLNSILFKNPSHVAFR